MSSKTWDELKSKHRLGRDNLRARFMDVMRAEFDAMVRSYMDLEGFVTPGVTVTAPGGVAGRVTALSGTQIVATDGDGTMIDLTSGTTDLDIEAFEATIATPYHVALNQAAIPAAVAYNPTSGLAEFTQTLERVGLKADPTTAIDDGDGTMTFVVDSVTEVAVTNAGRKVRVWKKTPLSAVFAVAVEELTVQWNGPGPLAGVNYIETTAQFGQTGVPSVVAADYSVALLGPEVKRDTNLKTSGTRAYVGTMTGDGAGGFGAVDLTNQRIYDSSLLAGLAEVLRIDAHGFTKVRVRADAADVDEPQIDVETTGGLHPFSVDEDGDTTIGESDPAFPNSPTLTLRDDTGEAAIKTIAGELDVLVPDGSTIALRSAANSAELEIDAKLRAVGAMEFEDANLLAALPLSSATDTTLNPALSSNILGALNEAKHQIDLRAASLTERSLLLGGAVSNGGGGLLDFSEAYYVRNGGFGVVVLPASAGVNPGVDDTYWTYIDASGNTFATTNSMSNVGQDDTLLARVVKAGGLITSVADLRLTRAMTNGREITSALTVGPSGMFATLKAAVDYANEVMAPSAGVAQRRIEIHVVGDTTEASAVSVQADGIRILGRPGAKCQWSGNANGIEINNANDFVLHTLTLAFTGAVDDAAALSRTTVKFVGADSNRARIEDVRVIRTGASAWHVGIGYAAGVEFHDCVFRNVTVEGASDFGMDVDGDRNRFENVRCLHADPAAGASQNTAGNGFRTSSDTNRASLRTVLCEDWAGDGIVLGGDKLAGTDLQTLDGDGHGIVLSACTRSHFHGLTIIGLTAGAKYGILVNTASADTSIEGFDVEGVQFASTNVGVRVDNCDRIQMTQGRIVSIGGNAMEWNDSDRGCVSDVFATDIANQSPAVARGLHVTNSDLNKFTNFDVNIAGASATKRAYDLDGTSDDNHLTGWTRNGFAMSDSGARNRVGPVVPDLTAGTEGANSVSVTIQLEDEHGDELAIQTDLDLQLLRADGSEAAAAVAYLADNSAGTVVTDDNRPRLLFRTDATGLADILVVDASTTLNETVRVVCTVLERDGVSRQVACVFAL